LALTRRKNSATMPDVGRFESNAPLSHQRQKSHFPLWERVEGRVVRAHPLGGASIGGNEPGEWKVASWTPTKQFPIGFN
jgi:hypothetical protein